MQRRNDHTHSTLPGLVASACACLPFWLCSGHAHAAQPYTSLKEIRERGVVMQQWENSCAAATLATVLTYGFRDPVTEHFVAAEMIDKSDPAKVRAQGGFSLLDMKRFAEARGYQARAYRDLSFNDLKAFKAPIVPISNYGYNHYVVFNGVQGDDVLLADPAFGNRKMRMNDFHEAWIEGMAFVVSGRDKDD
jgi:predicted double-glycine peptidase